MTQIKIQTPLLESRPSFTRHKHTDNYWWLRWSQANYKALPMIPVVCIDVVSALSHGGQTDGPSEQLRRMNQPGENYCCCGTIRKVYLYVAFPFLHPWCLSVLMEMHKPCTTLTFYVVWWIRQPRKTQQKQSKIEWFISLSEASLNIRSIDS